MINAILTGLLNMIATVVQVVCLPINALITQFLPGLDSAISQVTTTMSTVFNSISWALGLLPASLISTLSFILILEIAKHSIFIATSGVSKAWATFQRLKFW